LIAAVLFPVLATAKSVAKKSSCLTHFRVVSAASVMYESDYDDYFTPVNYQPGQTPNSRTDRTWVQLLLPYTPSFRVFECPADDSDRPSPEATFDQDLVPGDLYSEYYTASMRSNVGYNFQYLAPIFQVNGTYIARPISESTLPNPASMMEFLDSVWAVENGYPTGGGNWLVSPPCRYQQVNGTEVDTIAAALSSGTQNGNGAQLYAPMIGWEPQQDSASVYGGVWPWHLGKTNIATVYGTARSLTIDQIADGCNVQPEWTGNIYDRSVYAWSPD
jgi:hypothetical protein